MGLHLLPDFLQNCLNQFTPIWDKWAISFNVGYIDDSYLQGPSFDDCSTNVHDTVELFNKVGFIVNQEKSILIPTHELTFLGFILNSLNMTVRPTPEKADKLKMRCWALLAKPHASINEVSEVIGLMVSMFPGVEYAQLF